MKKRQRRFTPSRDQVTVLVHGLWMQGPLMRVMGKMLESRGFRTKAISYNFLSRTPIENAQHLYDEIGLLGAKKINLVGHSLGGIVILHLLHRFSDLQIDKVVLIGSPVKGSSVAKRVHDVPLLRPLLGRSVEGGLLGGAPVFALNRPLGIITGNGKLGLSALLYPSGEESDGVVRECETILENATDRISLPLSHSAMIFSRQCTEYVAQFLSTGRFRR
ncbi:MAG: pimeloyl-ACP methyl ester carboxylesterase [Porticoccaceae bacterium]|jgi:pimeloyl-ACP methyl ester carboxylesterase